MKKRKWAVEGNKPISSIMSFIHKYLKMDAEDKLVSVKMIFHFHLSIRHSIINVDLSIETLWKNLHVFFSVFAVSIRKSDICSSTGSNYKESVRLLRIEWEIGAVLLQKSGVGLIQFLLIFIFMFEFSLRLS